MHLLEGNSVQSRWSPDGFVTLKVFNVECKVWSHLKGNGIPCQCRLGPTRHDEYMSVLYVAVKVDRETL